ncbi:MAG: nitroreductase family protein [Candidatus Omnitrophica bacterium]|nr:nitroreductase family protein [Candidatus Omnitrophota bacterium]
MEARDVLKNRRSIRSFSQKLIPRNLIEELIDCARLAPTARNLQPWEFVVVTDKVILKKLGELADNGRFISDCACCIAVFCQDTKYYLEDGCAATENILLAAQDLGLVSCWVAGDKKPYCEEVKRLLEVPKDFKLVSLIPLGYPDDSGPRGQIPPKRSLKEVLHWEKFSSH